VERESLTEARWAASEARSVAGRCVVGVAFALASASTSLPAAAQAEVGKADALFNAGRSLLEAGEYSDACPKFAESQKLAPGLGVTLYLADCYERVGRTASALAEFRRAIVIAAARGDRRQSIAEERAANLLDRVPELVILVTPSARAEGVTVTRDGELVPSTEWDSPTPMDPGDHEIVVTAPSKAMRRLAVTLVAEKGIRTTVVDSLETPPLPSPLLPPPPPSASQDASGTSSGPFPSQRWASFAVGGAGALSVGVGIVLGAVAASKLHESNDGPCNSTDHCDATGLGLRQDAEHFGNAATGAFVVGGLALAAGVGLYLTAPKPHAGVVGLSLEPSVATRGVSLRAGSFF
jgi:hypothetical protein